MPGCAAKPINDLWDRRVPGHHGALAHPSGHDVRRAVVGRQLLDDIAAMFHDAYRLPFPCAAGAGHAENEFPHPRNECRECSFSAMSLWRGP
ncbi:hypothetical protein [Streptomyces sp. NPDC057545]|uniref:hypothetical protein n=1 Tax=Streptomyces sp. NPDC057545 TaxID=3346164 RepID=UPI0036785FDD